MTQTAIKSQEGLTAEHLTVKLGGADVVSDVSLYLGGHEMLVIVGPSGCGKTSLLRAIAGLLNLKFGRITLQGRDITNWPPAKRKIGMVFQEYALYSYRTVLGNIEFPLRMQGVDRAERVRRSIEIATRLGIKDLINRTPNELSGGERQRVALARALVRKPDLFLFDEPLSSVDAALQEELRSLLIELQREAAVPAIYVTHNQVEAWRIADRIAVMQHGILLQVGTPSELYEAPSNSFVAEFVGDVPMNTVSLEFLSASSREFLNTRWPTAGYLGIRMNDAVLTSDHGDILPSNENFLIKAIFHHVERVGGRLIAVTSVGDKKVRVLLGPHLAPQPAKEIYIKSKLDSAYLFDAQGQLIKNRGSSYEP